MESIEFLNGFLNEKDEFKKTSALIDFLCSLNSFDLNSVLFPTNILKYQKIPNGKEAQFSINDDVINESGKETVFHLLCVEIASRSKLYSIPLPPRIIQALIRGGIEWLKYAFAGGTSEISGASWDHFLYCVLPVYVLSIDGKSHQFNFANGNKRIMQQGWVKRSDLIKEVVINDKTGSFNQLQAVNSKFFRLHPEINFQVVCRSLFLNFLENEDKCFTRLFWGAFAMADIEDCMAEAAKFLAIQEVAANMKPITLEGPLCAYCKIKPIPSNRLARDAIYCSAKCQKDAANQRSK